MLGGVLRDHVPAGRVRALAGYRARPTPEEFTSYVGMVVFLGSWTMLFVALFFSYALIRARAPLWPPLGQPRLPVLLPGLNSLVIAASSVAVVAAGRAQGLGQRGRAGRALLVAAGLGVLFLSLQAVVWVGAYRAGLVPSGGPYPSVFYALTTFHALHVVVGLAALCALGARLLGARGGSRSAIRLWGMYWHFVGVVWAVLYVSVYIA